MEFEKVVHYICLGGGAGRSGWWVVEGVAILLLNYDQKQSWDILDLCTYMIY